MSVHNLSRNADVSVKRILDEKKRPLAHIEVDGLEHTFPHTSRISKHLDMMEEADLAERLSGGQFFFIEDKLIDFRDGNYHGFVHTDETIGIFMDVLGYVHKNQLNLAHLNKNKDEDVDSPILLRKNWDKNEIIVPGYASGGNFESMLSFTWNPFIKTVDSAFDLVRLICTNGMVGVTSFLNTKVPLMNRWEEHLDITCRQIQNKVSDVVVERIQLMSTNHSSVGDCLLLEEHILNRLQSSVDVTENSRLTTIMNAISPRIQLSSIYKNNVFDDKNLAAQLPAHLSEFDVFNIATEIRTHTQPTAKSSDNALDKFANGILFDRESNLNASASRLTTSKLNVFSSPETAFWGQVA